MTRAALDSYGIGEFASLTVAPTLKKGLGRSEVCCGPVWPDWDARNFERHCRNGQPIDVMPEVRAAPQDNLPGGAFWCGPIKQHFGHQIADYSMRILPSRFVDGRAKLLFSAEPGRPEPEWFRGILDWCGVAPDDIRIIRSPAVARNLRVVGQSEQLWSIGPSDAHLDAMDAFVASKRLGGERLMQTVYVSRAGLPVFKARFAGERYLEDCVWQAGGIVIRPETLPVPDQILHYISAPRLVFSEGSALHLLQFAGRSFGHVSVLQRRPHLTHFDCYVQPRAKVYRREAITKTLISGLGRTGSGARYSGISIPVPELTLEAFGQAGLDLRRHFNVVAFIREAANDVLAWVKAHTGQRSFPHWRENDRQVAAGLQEAGLDTLARSVLLTAGLGLKTDIQG